MSIQDAANLAPDERESSHILGTPPNPSPALGEVLTFADKRKAFFARHEALFLWLLAPPVVIIALLSLVALLVWTSGKGAILELFFRSGQWKP